MNPTVIAFVGLGANLGDMPATLRLATERIGQLPSTELLRLSRLYRTPAWGLEGQADFINAVAMLRTVLAPNVLLQALLEIEREFGRNRDRETRWGPRVLDLDLLLYGEGCIEEPGLSLPHPRLHERAFALVPLLEIAPGVRIPGLGEAQNILSGLDVSNIQPL